MNFNKLVRYKVLNNFFQFLVFKVLYRIVNVRFLRFPNQVAIRNTIVEKPPEESLTYEDRGVFVLIVKKNNCWEWSVRCGCIVFETGKCATKEEAIASAEARINRFRANDAGGTK